VNHNDVISLPVTTASSAGDIMVLNSDGTCTPYGAGNTKEKAIGVALHDVDPTEVGDPHAIHLFGGIFVAKAGGPISIGDIVGIRDGVATLQNSGTIRQVGIALENLTGVGLIRVIST